jgi:hypothetical protein
LYFRNRKKSLPRREKPVFIGANNCSGTYPLGGLVPEHCISETEKNHFPAGKNQFLLALTTVQALIPLGG